VIESPGILSEVKWQPFFADTTFGSQLPFEISPEALQAIKMIALKVGVFLFAVVY